MEDFCYR